MKIKRKEKVQHKGEKEMKKSPTFRQKIKDFQQLNHTLTPPPPHPPGDPSGHRHQIRVRRRLLHDLRLQRLPSPVRGGGAAGRPLLQRQDHGGAEAHGDFLVLPAGAGAQRADPG